MSVFKIAKDLEILEKQLREVENKVSDPIERLEQKKQLEKKIKKLERLKTQQEEYERQQQELEELKSEFSPDNSNSVEHQQEISTSASNKINIQPQHNLNQQFNSTVNSDNKITSKHLFIIGIIFSCVSAIALIINYSLTQQAEEIRLKNLAQQQAQQAKQEAFLAQQTAQQAIQEAIKVKKEAKEAIQEAQRQKQQFENLSTHNSYTISPNEFILNYYSNLNNRNYNSTWQHLTSEFQAKAGGFSNYTDWWNSVDYIEIEDIKVLEQSNYKASLNVKLKYLMKTGTTYKDPKSIIYLVWDISSNNWLLENKQ